MPRLNSKKEKRKSSDEQLVTKKPSQRCNIYSRKEFQEYFTKNSKCPALGCKLFE